MMDLALYTHFMAARAELLALVVPLALLAGEWPARLCRFDLLQAKGNRFLAIFERKLNRSHRRIATLVYRGIIALVILLIPALLAGGVLAHFFPSSQPVSLVLLILLFGHAFATYSSLRLWRQSRAGQLPLELPRLDFLFADTHAVLRYQILTRAEAFAVTLVGGSFWYVLGGLPLMFAYLTLAAAARHFQTMAFGWAARGLFRLVDALPQLISRILFLLAALFTPHTRPLATRRARSWRHFVANLLDIALGGPLPTGIALWVGEGTAQLTHQHLRRALHLQLVATVLLLLLLALPQCIKLLNNIV